MTCDNYSTNLAALKLLGADPNVLLSQDVNETDQIVTNLKAQFSIIAIYATSLTRKTLFLLIQIVSHTLVKIKSV